MEKLRRCPEGIPGQVPEVPYSDFEFSSLSRKFEFFSQACKALGLPAVPSHVEPVEGLIATPEKAKEYPLQIISARRNTHFHSFHVSHQVIPTLRALEPEPLLWIHPRDAAARGLEEGDLADLFNDRGKARVRVELTTEVLPGQVSLNDCWPELNEVTHSRCPVSPEVTALLKMGGQPSYQNVLVEISKARGGS